MSSFCVIFSLMRCKVIVHYSLILKRSYTQTLEHLHVSEKMAHSRTIFIVSVCCVFQCGGQLRRVTDFKWLLPMSIHAIFVFPILPVGVKAACIL